MDRRLAWPVLGMAALASAVLAWRVFAPESAPPLAERTGTGRAVAPQTGSPGTALAVASGAAAASLSQWTPLGPEGGSTSALAIRPDTPNVVFVLSELGALFKSTDAASSWTHIAQLPMQNARLEIAPDAPATMYAYNSYYHDWTYPGTDALPLRSVDGGLTWAPIPVAETSQVREWDLYSVNVLRTVPGKPGLLFAASEAAGLIRSSDGGAHWTRMTDAYNQPLDHCSGLQVVPARNKVYSVCDARPVVARLDGLGAVQQLTAGHLGDPNAGQDGEFNLRTKIAVSRSHPDVVYVAGSRYDEGNPRLITRILRSGDGGATWTTTFVRSTSATPDPDANPFNTALPGDFERDCSNPPNYGPSGPYQNYELAVDPADPDVLWVAGREVYRSDDGGATFGRAGTAEGYGERSLVFSPQYNGTSNQVLFSAGPSGVQRTTNARAAIQTYPASTCTNPGAAPAVGWTRMHSGFSATLLIHGLVGPDGTLVVGDLREGARLGGSGPGDWSAISPSVGQATLVPGVPRVFVSQDGHADRRTWNASLQRWDAYEVWFTGATPSGNGFIRPRVAGDSHSVFPLTYLTISQHATNSQRLLTATNDGAFASSDGGLSWTPAGPPFSVEKAWYRRDGSLIARASGNFVLENPAGSGNWETRDANGCLLTSGNTCSGGGSVVQELHLSPDPVSPAMYVAGTTPAGSGRPKILSSRDGKVWQAHDRPGEAGGLPDYVGMTTLAVDPDNLRHLYAGTALGLYRSVDNGQNWAPVETPFPGTAVSRLVFRKTANGERRLYAFTFGRGAWMWQVPASTTFSDIPTYFWAYSFVQKLYEAGITGGCRTTPLAYCPTNAVSRDQMAVFLLRAKHGRAYQPPAASGDFSDVPTTHWAAAWIERLRDEGITGGCGTSPLRYCPTGTVSRDQMAVFLLRAKHGASYQPPAATGMFADVPTSHWAAAWIEQLAREGVGGGCSTTPKNFCPSSAVTRDQMAVFLVRGFGI